MDRFDVIVIGGGHAGIEAAHAASVLGCRVLLVTLDIDGIGRLSCNPAVGGVSKGHLVREIDALGGLIGKIADRCALSFRILNRSKGKAVWASRAQVDRFLYPKVAREMLQENRNITILQAKATKILVKNKKVEGVEVDYGHVFGAKTVIICAGTFLKSVIHIGLRSFPGGRLYEESSDELFREIRKLGFATRHFKTGTCARIDARSLEYARMVEQFPDDDVDPFSFTNHSLPQNPMSCFITYTNKKTHKIILNNLDRSPLYTGKIKAQGVRYCPSLEDKIMKFSEKERHQVFIEPEGRDTIEVYPNGISTSLPFDVQIEFIHTIDGLENAKILRPGYGIEHGIIDARQLYPTLEARAIKGFYFAGQVNGTTGYEEAAAQGFVAGINAARTIRKKRPVVLKRSDAFIGVLIDDLTTKGADEPYRMFTSRCEFRLSLREGNAAFRLMPLGYQWGLIDACRYEEMKAQEAKIRKHLVRLRSTTILYESKKITLYELLKRPTIKYDQLKRNAGSTLPEKLAKEVEIQVKYEGFLRREQIWLKELGNLDRIKIPPHIVFSEVPSLSREIVEKLTRIKPVTLGEALRISGVTPAAIVQLYNYIRFQQKERKSVLRNS